MTHNSTCSVACFLEFGAATDSIVSVTSHRRAWRAARLPGKHAQEARRHLREPTHLRFSLDRMTRLTDVPFLAVRLLCGDQAAGQHTL
jgi:hypothetical protein